ncbi:MAG: hypothetical protein NWQ07_07760 [Flaviramulus sp.]|nr:hypothetical protein [Flaviramulus sp.]
MQRLSRENIQFIDNYLKNSDVLFTDIRVEMVDHVASDMEALMNEGDSREFYYIFKDYMIKNKSGLLKDNKQYYKASDKKILRSLTKKVCSFKGVTLFFLILFIFNFINEFSFVKNAPIVVIILIGILYFFSVNKNKERYSSVERITFYFMIIYYIINVFKITNFNYETVIIMNLTRLKIVSALIIFVLIMLFITGFEFKKEYELKYK